MSKITLEVSDSNVETVLTILNNLKSGLIVAVHVDEKKSKPKAMYIPKTKKVIKENEPVTGKYMSPSAFKKKLQEK